MKTDHMSGPALVMRPPNVLDYSLTGSNADRAVELGLAEADWYQTPIPRAELRELLQRRDGPAIRDTLILFGLLALTGYATAALWGSWWAAVPYFFYAVLYGTSSDSRWHECEHGTAFRSDWMNTVLYEIASFMVMRESVLWRWSHTRHHSDTVIVGRDPEIQLPRPPDLWGLFLAIFNIGVYQAHFTKLVTHATGRMQDDEKTYVPELEFPKIYLRARIYLLVYVGVIVWAVAGRTWLPVFLFILPQFFGTWLMILHNIPQHAGLAENVLDHRLNCRTVYMNPVSRFIYWNMNYHLEHHMFPLVPYHALPRLHELVKEDCPPPYPSILSAWKEILPTLIRQTKGPGVSRQTQATRAVRAFDGIAAALRSRAGCPGVGRGVRCRRGEPGRCYPVRPRQEDLRDLPGQRREGLHATDGVCTHGNTHLADGLVKDTVIECAKHNGRFHLADGSPARRPICRGLATYPIEDRNGRLWMNVTRPGGDGARAGSRRARVACGSHSERIHLHQGTGAGTGG